jgi:hypothetical protein
MKTGGVCPKRNKAGILQARQLDHDHAGHTKDEKDFYIDFACSNAGPT